MCVDSPKPIPSQTPVIGNEGRLTTLVSRGGATDNNKRRTTMRLREPQVSRHAHQRSCTRPIPGHVLRFGLGPLRCKLHSLSAQYAVCPAASPTRDSAATSQQTRVLLSWLASGGTAIAICHCASGCGLFISRVCVVFGLAVHYFELFFCVF